MCVCVCVLQSRRCGPPGTIRWNNVVILFRTTPQRNVVPTYYGRWVIYTFPGHCSPFYYMQHFHVSDFFFLCIRFIWLPEHDSKARIYILVKNILYNDAPLYLSNFVEIYVPDRTNLNS